MLVHVYIIPIYIHWVEYYIKGYYRALLNVKFIEKGEEVKYYILPFLSKFL